MHPSNVSSGIEGEGVISTMADCPLSRHRGRSLVTSPVCSLTIDTILVSTPVDLTECACSVKFWP